MRHISIVRCLIALTLALVAGSAAATELQTANIGGNERNWLVHLPPSYQAGHPMPLVIVYHGRGGNAEGMERLSKLDEVADRVGFIVVYPNGMQKSWAADVDSAADEAGVDDVAFTRALLDRLEQEYSIDKQHIVAAGFSNGAHMAQLLGCRLADRFTAIVPVSGTLASKDSAGCTPAKPITVVEFHGSADPIDPYGGATMGISHTGHIEPVTNGIWAWAVRSKCHTPATEVKLPSNGDPLRVYEDDFPQCAGGVHVRLYTIIGAGHVWPGGPQYLPERYIGKATSAIDASEIIGDVATGRL